MHRRRFVAALPLLATPLSSRGQTSPLPVIGYLNGRGAADSAPVIAAFREGLKEAGFVDGQNVVIESRFAEGQYERLPALAAELVARKVNVFVATGGTASVLKARPIVPETTPIVFVMGGDPVKLGVVASLARPGGNITGVTFLVNQLGSKSISLLHEMLPKVTLIGFLLNPEDPNAQSDLRDAQEAASKLKLKLVPVKARSGGELEAAFASLAKQKVGALFVATDPLFAFHKPALIQLATRHAIPAIYGLREFATAGGLMTYGTSITDANRQLGVYTGRVLKGTKPADLPVMQSMRFELIVNRKTADALKLAIPQTILLQATEVLE